MQTCTLIYSQRGMTQQCTAHTADLSGQTRCTLADSTQTDTPQPSTARTRPYQPFLNPRTHCVCTARGRIW